MTCCSEQQIKRTWEVPMRCKIPYGICASKISKWQVKDHLGKHPRTISLQTQLAVNVQLVAGGTSALANCTLWANFLVFWWRKLGMSENGHVPQMMGKWHVPQTHTCLSGVSFISYCGIYAIPDLRTRSGPTVAAPKKSQVCHRIPAFTWHVQNHQLGLLFPIYGKIKKCSKPPTSI